jgi:hypothetical protein
VPSFLRNIRSESGRRPFVAAALLSYLFASGGLPVPSTTGGKDQRHAFICQDHACGCVSAEQCWNACCCFSLDERIAWAAQHNAPPPAGIEPILASSRAAQCCDSSVGAQHCGPPSQQERHAPRAGSGVKLSFGFNVLRCRGLSTEWITIGAVEAPPPRVAWSPDATVIERIASHSDWLLRATLTPPVPPPRASI